MQFFDVRVLTHLHPQTVPRASLPRTNTMRRKGEAMSNASVRWNIVHSALRFRSNRRDWEGSPCYIPKIGVNAGGETRSAMISNYI